jgi:hypothetical protein
MEMESGLTIGLRVGLEYRVKYDQEKYASSSK